MHGINEQGHLQRYFYLKHFKQFDVRHSRDAWTYQKYWLERYLSYTSFSLMGLYLPALAGVSAMLLRGSDAVLFSVSMLCIALCMDSDMGCHALAICGTRLFLGCLRMFWTEYYHC